MASPIKDPWEKREAWRYTGQFSRAARFRNIFPGFGLGAGAFAVYLAVDAFLLNKH
ncbi:NADH-ubiquinone oxidoreductase B12 subunit [Dipodascopsis tothii]|uniref:NADH-ubiquinone oxidoreductase B12 subunit n=1 Tax=Dipodascopsis tothii TaxID=44089 RepID=UPI0034CD974F